MYDQLVDSVIGFIFPVEVVVHHSVGLGLGVRHDQSAGDCEVEFSRRESVGFCNFLGEEESTWFSSSYYSLTTLIS